VDGAASSIAFPSIGMISIFGALRGLRQLLWPKSSASVPDEPKKLRPTAYLDGLRGFAALLVFIQHHEEWAHCFSIPIFEGGFGYRGNYYFATFPWVRMLFTGGHAAVATFYIISGYVLTWKPLSLIHAGEHLKLFDSLASAFFRRWFRLYIPLIVTTFFWITSWHVFNYWNAACEPKATYREELWNWYNEMKNFSFLFKDGGMVWVTFNTHLWSIPLEMRGSMVVFISCITLARATTKARLLVELVLMFYFLYIVDGYYLALFLSGMMQCELDLLAKKDGWFPGFLRRLEPRKTLLYYLGLFVALYIAGVPSEKAEVEYLREQPGWYYMSYLTPSAMYDHKWIYLFFSCNIIMAAIPRIGWLKRFFESRFCQFLGYVSFAFYLVHGPILASIGDRVYYAVGWTRPPNDRHEQVAHWANLFPLPKKGPMGLEIAFLVPNLLVLLPFTLWVANIVTRMVDEPAVKFAAWLYKRVQGGGSQEPKPVELAPLMRVE